MAAILVNNTDFAILADVKAALAGATLDGETVFAAVTATTSAPQSKAAQFTASPVCVVRYVSTVEADGAEDTRCCAVRLELILATREAAGRDESDRIEEVLRLRCAAINAVGAAVPAAASACGRGLAFRRPIQWGQPSLDTSVGQPWAVCLQPVEIGFIVASPTAH